MKNIKTVGVVGAGTMGSALAQKFAQEGFKVILADREMKFVEKGLNGIKAMLNEGLEKKVFTQEQVTFALSNLTGTENLADLNVCDIIIEAIFEDINAKSELFKTLSDVVPTDTILATNTSSFSVTEIATSVKNPERFLGLHYFYHAAKNRLVEIIPGAKTSKETLKAAHQFAILSGKDPIYTKDAYGFAVNRFFVPWLNESVKLLKENIGSIEAIDAACMKAFGIGMGPFALMNATGVPIALHAERTLEFFGPSYKVGILLEKQVAKKENWNIGDMTAVSIDADLDKKIAERMLGCVFFVCSQLLEEEICSAIDLNKGAKIGLKWRKGPIDLMKQFGDAEVFRLVQNYCAIYNEKIPKVNASDWKMEYVLLEKEGDRAIITMNRPEDLNSLNEEVMALLDEKFTDASNDAAIKTIFITGTGKAFVAGADIKFFVKHMKNKSLDKIVEFTKYGQGVLEKIDKSSKKVVVIMNGMALGGGLELALCGDVILSVGKATMAFPETGIGIYPGLGGTQRTIPRVGKGLAKYLILTGKMLAAKEAEEIGLIDAVITVDDLFVILNGDKAVPTIPKKELNGKWKAISELYSNNNFKQIINGDYSNGHIEQEEVAKIGKTMSFKAPIAMKIAEDLINENKGPQSELDKLTTIFSTNDAMLGLTSIGKRVEFKGE
ncbi:MAG: 3-hydroxyacyl-CoA dehydrogenase/enoyl-CoA hydratase family protein [Bacteroidota bacterium]